MALVDERPFDEEIGRRALPQYLDGYYGDAVFNAFKVVEEALRAALGDEGRTAHQLIIEAFKPQGGRLHDPQRLNDERVAVLNLFQGAFGFFRNPHGHGFPEVDARTAFDELIIADVLLRIIRESHTSPSVTAMPESGSPQVSYDLERKQVFALDIDDDGHDEFILLPSSLGSTFTLIDDDGRSSIEIDTAVLNEFPGVITDFALVDIDNDTRNEVLVVMPGVTTGSALYFFRCTERKCVWLRKLGDNQFQGFLDATVDDFDDDGLLEVREAPWDRIPDELWPDEKSRDLNDWGRVQTLWRWRRDRKGFETTGPPELLYIGGR